MDCTAEIVAEIKAKFLWKFFEDLDLTEVEICLAWTEAMTLCSAFMKDCPNFLKDYYMYKFFEFLYIMYIQGLFGTETPVIDPGQGGDGGKVISYVKKDTVKDVSREYFQPGIEKKDSKCVRCKDTPINWLLKQIECLEKMCFLACMPMSTGTNYGLRVDDCGNCVKDNLLPLDNRFADSWRLRNG